MLEEIYEPDICPHYPNWLHPRAEGVVRAKAKASIMRMHAHAAYPAFEKPPQYLECHLHTSVVTSPCDGRTTWHGLSCAPCWPTWSGVSQPWPQRAVRPGSNSVDRDGDSRYAHAARVAVKMINPSRPGAHNGRRRGSIEVDLVDASAVVDSSHSSRRSTTPRTAVAAGNFSFRCGPDQTTRRRGRILQGSLVMLYETRQEA